MDTNFGYIPVASPLAGAAALEQLVADYVPAFRELGGGRWGEDELEQPEPLFFWVGTGGTEQQILKLHDQRAESVADEPVILLAHPGNNSLPAAMEVLGKLQQEGQRGRILYLNGPSDREGLQQVQATAGNLATYHAMRRLRIGLIGAASDWLVASSPEPDTVKTVWGPNVVSIDLQELKQAIQSVPHDATAPLREPLVAGATEVREPSTSELDDAVRVYLATKELVKRHRLNALTLQCFELVVGLKTTGCFALARLTDEGVIAGCEGDLPSVVGMAWVHQLLRRTPWMANSSSVNDEQNTIRLAHCTVPGQLVENYQLRSHFESGLGVGIQGQLPAGPVTLLRIGGKRMEKLWMAEGEMTPFGPAENLCRTQVDVHLTRKGHVRELLRSPLANHLVLVQGHHAERLRGYRDFLVTEVGQQE